MNKKTFHDPVGLSLFLAWAAFIFFLVFLFVFLASGVNGPFQRDFCFSNECFLSFYSYYEAAFRSAEFLLTILFGLATVGGILIALMSYVNNQHANALSNHLSHFSVFQNYLKYEIDRRPLLGKDSVDILKWYNFVFDRSREGVTSVSSLYREFLFSLNNEVEFSNSQANQAKPGSFKYVPHQTRMISVLMTIGINVDRAPRNHFFEVEQEVFSLIKTINKEFCFGSDLPEVRQSEYL